MFVGFIFAEVVTKATGVEEIAEGHHTKREKEKVWGLRALTFNG